MRTERFSRNTGSRRSRTVPPAGTRCRLPWSEPRHLLALATRECYVSWGMVERAELGPRKSAVLHAIVDEYVRSGEPVGSETIAERAGIGVSSATIRNEMAALEEIGYLTHPHTSAGRIPTDIGYRHYVDSLPAGGRLRDAQRRAIASYFAEAILDLEEVLKGSVQLLSRLTQYAGLAVPPSVAEEPIVRLELIDMGPTMMVLAVGQHGRVDKRILDRPETLDDQALRETERRLEALRGLTYTEAQARLLKLAAEEAREHRDLLLDVAETLRTAQQGESGGHVVVGGVSNLAGVAARDAASPVRNARAGAGHHARPAGRELRRARPRRDDRDRAPHDRRVG